MVLVVREVYWALIDVYPEALCSPCTSEGWKKIADLFQDWWNYPNCIGAMDVKHIAIQKRPGTGKTFINYKLLLYCHVCHCRVGLQINWFDMGANNAASDMDKSVINVI